MQAELDRMAQTGRVRLSPALANLTPAGHMTARCLEGGRMQLDFDSPMRSPPRSVSAHACCPQVLLVRIRLRLHPSSLLRRYRHASTAAAVICIHRSHELPIGPLIQTLRTCMSLAAHALLP